MSESVPSSLTGFAHRKSRADSITSFTYFQEDQESPDWPDDEEAILEHDEEDSDAGKQLEDDTESVETPPKRRKSSGYSRTSVEDPLLSRYDSARTDASNSGQRARTNQKIYVVAEDLTIVVAGFTTRSTGFIAYIAICAFTLGLGYLILRWFPRWRVRLTGSPKPLRECTWVVIEVRSTYVRRKSKAGAKVDQNQWAEFAVQYISKAQYGHAISTVFGSVEKRGFHEYDEDDDPVMMQLRFLDYRYIRFCYHPLKDKFVLSSNWKDPTWTDVKSVRAGLDSDERYRREQVFGMNQIDIKQKSILQLLIDEVLTYTSTLKVLELISSRLFIHSMFFKLRVLFYGPSTSITTMQSASSSSL